MKQMFFEYKSKLGFDETISELIGIIHAGRWRVMHIHDLQETMSKNGKEILPIKNMELCNPAYAYRLLSEDEFRIYSTMIPCRISVYKKADGNIYISQMNSALFASQVGGELQKIMSIAYTEVESFINEIVE
jgi:uncharacterized protein (DUF302 family)